MENDAKKFSIGDLVFLTSRRSPFYGDVLFIMKVVEDRKMQYTMGVSAKGGITLYYNPERLTKYTLDEQLADLEHEVLHVVMRHFAREDNILGWKPDGLKGEVHPSSAHRTWNYAADMSINTLIGNLSKDSVFPGQFDFPDGLSAEEYYKLLLEKAVGENKIVQIPCGAGKSGGKGGEESGDGGSKADIPLSGKGGEKGGGAGRPEPGQRGDHSRWGEATEAEKRDAHHLVEAAIRSSHQRGHLPGSMEEQLKNVLEPRMPWRSILRSFFTVTSASTKRRTWMKPNRMCPGVFKGKTRRPAYNLVVVVDSSGSMIEALQKTVPEIEEIARSCTDCVVSTQIIYCDADVKAVYKYEGHIRPFKGLRGTAFTPAFEYLMDGKNGIRADGVIYMTDGYGDNPRRFPLPVLWLVFPTGGRRGPAPASWGKVLHMP